MAMKKAEMEAHHQEYNALMTQAGSAERKGLYRTAVELALKSWPFIDGMMQFESRYADGDFSRVRGIEIVLKYAPFLFDYPSLDALESLLKETRRIEKNTEGSMSEKLAEARALMWDAHRLWDYLENNPDSMQDELRQILGGEQEHWRSIAEAWDRMGLLQRTPERNSYRLSLSTRMGKVVSAKCPSCGGVVSAPKAMLLETTNCPECQKTALFVILTTDVTTNSKD